MRGLVALIPVLAVGLAACGGTDTAAKPAKPAAKASPSRTASPSRSPEPSEPPTSDVKDCRDGTCLLKVDGPVRIPLDKKRFHYSSLRVVDVTSSSLSYQVPYPNGGGSSQTLSPGGGGAFGFRTRPSIAVKLVSMKDGKGLLSLTAGKSLN